MEADEGEEWEKLKTRKSNRDWDEYYKSKEGLPIKKAGKVIQVSRVDVRMPGDIDDLEGDAPEAVEDELDSTAALSSDDEFLTEKELELAAKRSGKHGSVLPMGKLKKFKQRIASICTFIMANPELSFSKKKESDSDSSYRFVDLLECLEHSDQRVVELAMFSCMVVFKDLLPSYRIRNAAEDKSVQLKKETKRLAGFEQSLLTTYSKFLKFLESSVKDGLHSFKTTDVEWSINATHGLNALRCQCELLKAAPHFNFRSLLLTSVVERACQQVQEISSLCCETLRRLISGDIDGELSYELVRTLAKALTSSRYDVPEEVIRCLEGIKVRIHADQASDIRRKDKMARKKRKRSKDDVEVGLLEASGSNDLTKKRFQADVLHEICLIYFRIIKQKVGFRLIPVALEGLGRISHLINMDTVVDLVSLMKSLVTSTSPSAPVLVQLYAIHCALRTLSGPGQELGLDDEAFLFGLRDILCEIPSDCERWDLALECVEYCVIKKREIRLHLVRSFIRSLLVISCHTPTNVAAATLALLHSVVLKYPSIRSELALLTTTTTTVASSLDEERVEDLAMCGLQESSRKSNTESVTDASWVLELLKYHHDGRLRRIVSSLLGKESIPILFRASEARGMTRVSYAKQRLDSALKIFDSNSTKKTKCK